jgi:phosphoribosyl 1,2-cyclic phosphate phosphodiesterase
LGSLSERERHHKMKLTILGSAAAEAIPNPFCRCRVCETARREGGVEVKARASALLDDAVLFDLGPDLLASANREGLYLGELKALLLTHRHADHWLVQNLHWRQPTFAPTPMAQLAIYGPKDAMRDLTPDAAEAAQFTYQAVAAGDRWSVDDYQITAIPATHGGGELEPLLYVVEREGRRVFYATDTAPLKDAAWRLLRPMGPMDVIMLDATSGHRSGGEAHHGMAQFLETRARMLQEGLIREGRTNLVAYHFSHNGGLTHREAVEAYGRHDVAVAYDGMVLTI